MRGRGCAGCIVCKESKSWKVLLCFSSTAEDFLIRFCLACGFSKVRRAINSRKFVNLTYRRSHGQDNTVAGVFYEVDYIAVVEVRNVHAVDGQNAVANVETAASFGRTTGNDPADGGTGPWGRRDDDEPEALVFSSVHSHVIRIFSWSPSDVI